MGILVQRIDGIPVRRTFGTPEEVRNGLDEFFSKLLWQEKPVSRMNHLFGMLTRTRTRVSEGGITAQDAAAMLEGCIAILRDMEADLKYASELIKELADGQCEEG